MDNTEAKNKKSAGKRQTEILIGIAMIILSAVFVYFAVSQPSVDRVIGTTSGGNYSQQAGQTDDPATESVSFSNIFADGQESQQGNDGLMSDNTLSNDAPHSNAPTQAPTSAQTETPTQAPTNAPTQAPTKAPTQAPTKAPTVQTEVKYPLNLNTCTAEELMTISGIGEVRAASIIAYREYLGGYTNVEQLKNISGIGDGIFAKIEPYVTV